MIDILSSNVYHWYLIIQNSLLISCHPIFIIDILSFNIYNWYFIIQYLKLILNKHLIFYIYYQYLIMQYLSMISYHKVFNNYWTDMYLLFWVFSPPSKLIIYYHCWLLSIIHRRGNHTNFSQKRRSKCVKNSNLKLSQIPCEHSLWHSVLRSVATYSECLKSFSYRFHCRHSWNSCIPPKIRIVLE